MLGYSDPTKRQTVLVTGAFSYLGSLIVASLLNLNYIVRGSTRSKKENNLNYFTESVSLDKMKNFFVFEADLMDSELIWGKIIEGCDHVIHVASPNGIDNNLDKNYQAELLLPCLKGAETIFTTAVKFKVKKFLMISCITTIVTSKKKNYIFTEKDWAEPKDLNKIALSKYLSEKKLWDLYSKHKEQISFASIVPGLMIGPSLKPFLSVSALFFKKAFDNSMTRVPHISFPLVDVRDVAKVVVLALENPISNGKRYLVVQGSYWWQDITNIMREEFEKYGYNFPKKKMSSFWVKIAAWWNPFLEYIKPYLEGELIIDTSLLSNEIGMGFRKIEDSIKDFGYDLIKKKLIEDKLFFIGDDKDPPYLH